MVMVMVVVGMVVVVVCRSTEKASWDVRRAGGMRWRRGRGRATGIGGGQLLVDGREALGVRGWQREGGRGYQGRGHRRSQVGSWVGVRVVRVLLGVRVGDPGMSGGRLSCRRLRAAAGEEVPVARLRSQLELHEHHVITHTQRQREWRAAGQEVTDLQTHKQSHVRLTLVLQ